MPGEERLRLLFINHWAARMGGAEHSLLDILEEASRRAEVFLVTSEPGILADRAQRFGVAVSVIRCSSSLNMVRRKGLAVSALRHWPALLSFFGYVLKVRALVRRVRPHLIHANVPKSHSALFLLARLGYAGSCCFHIREIFDRKTAPYRIYSILFPKRSAFIVAISKAVRETLPPALQKKASVLYNGVAIPLLASDRAEKDRALQFLYLGRVVPWKGCHLLIEAFSKLQRGRGATLDIIGDTLYWDASYRTGLEEQIARAGCAATCRLLPHTADPLEAMREHDVFCIASENEPFGRVAAEAMGCGLPVIGFAAGGLPELVENGVTGILVPVEDRAALASALQLFVDKPEMIGIMGSAARKRAENLFDKKVRIKKIVDLLEQEAGNSSAAIAKPAALSPQ